MFALTDWLGYVISSVMSKLGTFSLRFICAVAAVAGCSTGLRALLFLDSVNKP